MTYLVVKRCWFKINTSIFILHVFPKYFLTHVKESSLTEIVLKARTPKTPSLACTGIFLCLRQLLGRGERTHNALCYCECVLSIHCELLNHLLTTAWRELRQWLVNTLEWMKGLGIKWQDVLKEEQVVVEEGPAKEWNIMHLSVAFSPFCSSSCSVSTALDLSHLPSVAHLFLLISLAFYLISALSISIVHFYTTREACSLTLVSDNWHSWDWTFRSIPIHMYSKQRDKSYLTL